MAATAIQKSNRWTRASRRISGTSIMPITTASMISAASTGLGRSENSGARTSSVSRTVTPEVSDARPVLAPEWSLSELADRLVETGMPWNSPGAGVGERLGDRLLVDVDLVAVLGGERPGVAGGLREADQHQRDRGERDRADVVPHQLEVGDLERRQPARHVADQGHAVGAEVEQPRREQPARRRARARRGPGARPPAARRRRPARRRRRRTVGRLRLAERARATTTAPGAGWCR